MSSSFPSNAVAHRSYDDASRKVNIRVFSDRGGCQSRLPAFSSHFGQAQTRQLRGLLARPGYGSNPGDSEIMEQRGSGFARMHDAMLMLAFETDTKTDTKRYKIGRFV